MALLTINGEKVDPSSSKHRVYFENLVPMQAQTSDIVIRNLATVDLKYRWRIQPNSRLRIEPLEGVFKPMEEKTLMITYLTANTVPILENVSL
jgi:hypothetical protein